MSHRAKSITALQSLKAPWVIAHRGFSGQFPENTLVAFEAAVGGRADMIELDVSLSRERVPLVIHDDTLERTTSGSGRVQDLTLPELQRLDAGNWFGEPFRGARIPTLEEVFRRVGPQIAINVELKPKGFEEDNPEDALERQVLDLIRKHGLHESTLISSFEWRFFPRIRQLNSEIPLAVLWGAGPLESALETAQTHRAVTLNPDEGQLTPRLVEQAHAVGLRVLSYTVNTRERMQEVLSWGVDGLFTNEPVLMREVLAAR
jgi:glycerophosphoryl diester phosphodiesterase